MELKIFNSISDISADEWDSLVNDSNFFHSHQSLKALEKSGVENSIIEYVCIYDDDKLILTTVLSIFSIDLSLFIGENRGVRLLKQLMPRFFNITVLFCGTPVSAGHKNLYFEKDTDKKAALQKILNLIDQICKERNIKYSVFKEFYQEELDGLEERFKSGGYFKGFSIPTVILELPFRNYPEYLHSLRSGYRRQIKQSLKKIRQEVPKFVQDYFDGPQDEEYPVFTLLKPENIDVREFYHLYLCVMERAKVKLETLNQTFFENLFNLSGNNLKNIAMVFQGRILGVFTTAFVRDETIFIWTGKEFDKNKYETYQNLMQAMVFWAITNNSKRLVLGQTSYYPKMKTGGKPKDLFIFFKCHNRTKHRLLSSLKNLLFPRLETDELRALKA